MDAQPNRKRGRRRRGSSNVVEDFVGYSGPGGAGTLEGDLMQAQREMGISAEQPSSEGHRIALDPQLVGQEDGTGSGGTDGEGGGRKRGKIVNDPA